MPALLALADDVRSQYCGNEIAVEVLYNAKKGGCSEDCNFCSQSARYATDVEAEPLSSVEDFVAAARAAHARGAGEFCIVVAVRGPSEKLLERVCAAVEEIKAELPLTVAVSLGILNDRQIERLARAGVDKVNHNLETSRRYFPQVCTTHTYDERWETCQRVKRHDLELCCGGIIGMGEEVADRLDFLSARCKNSSPKRCRSTFSIRARARRSGTGRWSIRSKRCASWRWRVSPCRARSCALPAGAR